MEDIKSRFINQSWTVLETFRNRQSTINLWYSYPWLFIHGNLPRKANIRRNRLWIIASKDDNIWITQTSKARISEESELTARFCSNLSYDPLSSSWSVELYSFITCLQNILSTKHWNIRTAPVARCLYLYSSTTRIHLLY